MGRRSADVEAARQAEPPKKRLRTISETLNLQPNIKIDKPLPYGEILTDVTQKEWKIGKPIGCGSFGEIYLASDDVDSEVTSQNSRYVIKIEPHSNGPLFVEIHCLIRSARHSKIAKWKKEKKLASIGMPHYIANGSHLLDETRYRFLVLPRYDCDVEKILTSANSRQISPKNVLILAAQIIDVLEYIHAHGYTHSDIKSSNLMVGFDGAALRDPTSINSRIVKHNDHEDEAEVAKKSPPKSDKQKAKYSSYYYDEDFVLHNYLSSTSNTDYETDEEKCNHERKSRTSKIAAKSPKSKKSANRMRRLFNLRKIKSDVNYEDMNSSICSYDSYQELVEQHVNTDVHSYAEATDENIIDSDSDHFHEAIESQSQGQVYLLDFGLASKFLNSDGSHKEFGMDQRKAHDGTLEYSSRDSHIGAHSRRSDLENLGYNLIDWMTGGLPWKTSETLADPELVFALKKSYTEDLNRFMENCFKSSDYPKFIEKYFQHVNKLDFAEKPDYRFCKNLFVDEFIRCGYGSRKDMVLNFSPSAPVKRKINYSKRVPKTPSKNTPPDFKKRNAIVKVFGRENSHVSSLKNDLKMDLIREGLSNDGVRKPCISRNFYVSDADLIAKLRQTLLMNQDTPSKKFSPKNLRSTRKPIKKKKGKNTKSTIGKFGNFMGSDKQYTWAEILAGNPERIIRKNERDKSNPNADYDYSKNPRSRKASSASEISVANMDLHAAQNILSPSYVNGLNPTYAIREVVANYKRKTMGRPNRSEFEETIFNDQICTPSMIKVINAIEKMKKKGSAISEKEEVNVRFKKRRATVKKLSVIHEKPEEIAKKSRARKTVPVRKAVARKVAAKTKKDVEKSSKRSDSKKAVEKKSEPSRNLRKRPSVKEIEKIAQPVEKLKQQTSATKSPRTTVETSTATKRPRAQSPEKKNKRIAKGEHPEKKRINTRSRAKV